MDDAPRRLQDKDEAQEPQEGYTAPKLTDLGSFEDLTQAGTGNTPDANEGLS
jgi:hypothetical protein